MIVRMKCLRCSHSFSSSTLSVGDENVPQQQECPKCSGQSVEMLPEWRPVRSWNYPLEIIDGHMIVDVEEKRCLLDTGAINCITAGAEPLVEFAGKKWHATQKYMGVMLRDIAEEVGVELDAMIGNNALSSLSWMPRMDEGVVSVWHSTPKEWNDEMSWKTLRRSCVPIITVRLYGRNHSAVIDTGAKVCYTKKHIWDGIAGNIINTTDFFPTPKGIELFDVPMKLTALGLGGAIRRMRDKDGAFLSAVENVQLPEVVLPLGILPEHLEIILEGFSADFILGPEVLQAIPMAFDLSEGKVYFKGGVH